MAGCSSIESKAVGTGAPAESAGISYYLPKRLVRIVIDRKAADPATADLAAAVVVGKARAETAAADVETKKTAEDKARAELQAARDAKLPDGELDAALKKAEAELAKAKALSLVRKAQYDAAIEALRAAEPSEGKYEETFSIVPTDFVPDESKRYIARLDHNWLRDDKWNVTTTKSGLLTTTVVTPDGQLDEVATEVAKLALVFSGGFPASPVAKFGNKYTMARVAKEEGRGPDCPPLFHYDREFDPANASLTTINEELGRLCSIYRLEFPRVADQSTGPDASLLGQGLAYRRERPWTLTVKKFPIDDPPLDVLAEQSGYQPFRAVTLMLPNGAPVEVLPYGGNVFTDQNYTGTFDNGMLTTADFTQPSEIKSVALIPVNAISGAAALAGSLLSVRLNTTTAQVNDATQSTILLGEGVKQLKAQQDYENAMKKYIAGEPIPEPESANDD